ncbi:hypothetical protein HK405_001132 [Cladochytrium tenue]|nr:hypothetical protein HK405_001132 [Cladochytrium tenue]
MYTAWLQKFPHAPPPCTLPPKAFSVFGSATLNDPTKANERRVALEKFLLDVLHSDDDRWRVSPEWAAFIGLPSPDAAAAAAAATVPSISRQRLTAAGAGVAVASSSSSESWMDDYRRALSACRDIRAAAVQRDAYSAAGDVQKAQSVWIQAKRSHAAALASVASLRASLDADTSRPDPTTATAGTTPPDSKFDAAASSASANPIVAALSLGGLNTLLGIHSANSAPSLSPSTHPPSPQPPLPRISKAEAARREDLLANLKIELDRLANMLSAPKSAAADVFSSQPAAVPPPTPSRPPPPTPSRPPAASSSQPSTPAPAAPAARTTPRSGRRFGAAPPQETEQTRGLDNGGLVQLQRRAMADQDEALTALSAIVRRQREIGVAMGDELDLQNRLLDDLGDGVERVGENLKSASRKLDGVARRR